MVTVSRVLHAGVCVTEVHDDRQVTGAAVGMNVVADWEDVCWECVRVNHLLCHMSESNLSKLELHKLSLHAEDACVLALARALSLSHTFSNHKTNNFPLTFTEH